MCERYKNISFLYYCDGIEMIVRTKKKKIIIIIIMIINRARTRSKQFFNSYEPTDIELFPLLLNVAHS